MDINISITEWVLLIAIVSGLITILVFLIGGLE